MSSAVKSWTWAVPDRDGVCASQTLGAAGALTINGAFLDLNTLWRRGERRAPMSADRIERTVSLYSTGNLSGINFTITGWDSNYVTISETLAGPNNTTVYTTAKFWGVTSVTANAAVATAVEVGSGTTGNTGWYPVNSLVTPINMGLSLVIAGTISVTVQHTFKDVLGGETVASTDIHNHDDLATEAATVDGNYAFGIAACRAAVVSSSSDGAVVFSVVPAG